jgi:hypothetical protein
MASTATVTVIDVSTKNFAMYIPPKSDLVVHPIWGGFQNTPYKLLTVIMLGEGGLIDKVKLSF